MAGTPAVVLAHDSRTLELARYFDIPHRLIGEVPADVDAADLYAEADFTAFNAGHAARFATFTDFLSRHGLEHAFGAGETDPSFETRSAATDYPPAVTMADRRPPRVWPGMPAERVAARDVGCAVRGSADPGRRRSADAAAPPARKP